MAAEKMEKPGKKKSRSIICGGAGDSDGDEAPAKMGEAPIPVADEGREVSMKACINRRREYCCAE